MSGPMINLKKVDPTDLRKFSVEPVLANMKSLHVKANVVLVLDDSGSMEHEYEEGHVQLITERALALAMVWDVDQKLDIYTLNRGYIGTVDPASIPGWVDRHIDKNRLGSTPFSRVIRAVTERYSERPTTYSFINILRLLFGRPKPVDPTLPTYVLFITDGECNSDDRSSTVDALLHAVGGPVFFQFLGLGEETFEYLQELVKTCRNASFVRMPCEDEGATIDDGWLYQQLTAGFSRWLKNREAVQKAG